MTTNSDTIIRMLRQAVHGNPELQAQLFNIDNADSFVAAVRQLALDSGYELQDVDIRQAMLAKRRAWSDRKRP